MSVPQILTGGIWPMSYQGITANAVRNNGGVVYYGGGSTTLQNNRLFDSNFGSLGLSYIGRFQRVSQNNPIIGFNSAIGAVKALSSGTFGTMVRGQYVMLTFTSQLAGVANTVMSFAASANRKSQNTKLSFLNTRLINSTGGFYMMNGQAVNATLSRDNIKTETYPGTYAVPGRITFLATGKTAATQSYAAKTD